MACGYLAMLGAGVEIERYVAYEIDKYAIKVASHNFPDIEQQGDVFTADFTEFEGFDAVVGGSPCTHWSIAQHPDKRETTASGIGWELFQQYVRGVREAKPKFFVYENNKSMSKEIKASITETFGFDPILINSALVSAQNRQRLYWVGIRQEDGTYRKADIKQPEDKGILLRDILETGVAWREKSYCLDACYYKGGNLTGFEKQSGKRLMAAEPLKPLSAREMDYMVREVAGGRNHFDFGYIQDGTKDKGKCLTANASKGVPYNVMCEPVCMCYKRTEEAKRVRKAYEAGEIHHGYHELSELHAREDGKTNTLSTVLKDNPICEPVRIGCMPSPDGTLKNSQGMRVYSIDGKAVNQTANGGGLGAKTGLYAAPVNTTVDGKAQCLRATCYKDGIRNMVGNNVDKKTCVAVSCPEPPFECTGWHLRGGVLTNGFCQIITHNQPVYEVKNGLITIKDKQYPIKLVDGYYIIRKLTVRECMSLQTVPEWYDFSVISNAQAYKCLGNGWTVDVITHLIKGALEEVDHDRD